MLAAQYTLKCHHPSHPNYELTRQPIPPRQIRKSATSRYKDGIQLLPRPTSTRRLNRGTKIIHSSVVTETIENYCENRVLRTRPPTINPDERTLPRTTHTALAQLRSGWCRRLSSYHAKIDETIPDVCPECGQSPHDVDHLFNCPEHPTDYTTEDLWTKPIVVSEFLQLKDEQEP